MKLLTPIKVGDVEWSNRVVMAALTRTRCDPTTHVANDLLKEYYSARASAGMILTECSAIRPDGDAFPGCAWIYNDEQVEGWRQVIDEVHKKGGKIYIQIWHGGRAVHPENSGFPNVGPSAIPIDGEQHTKSGRVPQATPRELTIDEIKELVQDFRKGAENAKKAGFDGIELHAAHGYIIDQFLRDSANKRTDIYGGSIENRARLCLEVLDEIIAVFGSGRTGLKLSPTNDYNSMNDSDPFALLEYLIGEFNKRNVAFIEVSENVSFNPTPEVVEERRKLFFGDKPFKTTRDGYRKLFNGVWIANNQFNRDTAEVAIEDGSADAVSFGNLYCQNDNLVEKFAKGLKANGEKVPFNMGWFKWYYGHGAEGYTDLSVYETREEEESKQQE